MLTSVMRPNGEAAPLFIIKEERQGRLRVARHVRQHAKRVERGTESLVAHEKLLVEVETWFGSTYAQFFDDHDRLPTDVHSRLLGYPTSWLERRTLDSQYLYLVPVAAFLVALMILLTGHAVETASQTLSLVITFLIAAAIAALVTFSGVLILRRRQPGELRRRAEDFSKFQELKASNHEREAN